MKSFSNLPIDFDSIPKAEEIDFLPIEKKYLGVNLFTTSIIYLIFSLMCVGIIYAINSRDKINSEVFQYVIIALLSIYIIVVLLILFGFKWKGYIMREKDIIYRTGLIFRKRVHIPFNRVQHCEVAQDLIERNFNLAKLKIYTAGGSRSDLSIPGLLHDDALKMKQFILKKAEDIEQKIVFDDESE